MTVKWMAVAVIAPLLITGCAASDDDRALPDGIPEDAIPVSKDMYMVPLGRDDMGCMMYQAHAPGKLVAQVIHYRAADGRFVTDKRKAACMTED